MADIINVVEIDIDVNTAVANLAETQKEVAKLKAEIKALSKAEGDNSKAIAEKTGQLKVEQAQLRQNTNVLKANIIASKDNVSTLDELAAKNTILRAERGKLNIATDEGRKRTEEINAQLDINNEIIKENSDKQKQNKLSVGGYADGIKEALPITAQFNSGLKALAANPIGLVITAIVVTVKALFDAFKKTQGGADKLSKITAVLSGVFEVLQGILAVVATEIVGVFEKPREAMDTFIKNFKEGIVNRFEGLYELIPRLADATVKLFEGDFSGAAETAADAVAKVTLGVEDFTEKAGDFYDETSDKIKSAAERALALKNAQIALENTVIANTTALAKLNKEAEKQQQIADDSTQSFEERQKAADLARIASEKALQLELNLARQESAIVALQIKQKREAGFETRALKLQEADAIAKVIDAESALTLKIAENAKLREELDRDVFEKNLDYLLDNYDNIKTINEKLSTDEKKSYEERLKIIQVTRDLGNASFNEQIKELQTRTDETINANDLINESDSRRLIEKVRLLKLDEIEETRLLEVLRDRRTAVQDLADAEIAITETKNEELKAFNDSARTRELEAQKQTIFTELELNRVKLQAQEEQEIMAAERIGASTTEIEQKYANAREEINKAELNAKLSLAGGFADNLATIAGEGTAIGKAAAIASTTISTYQGATAAFASLAGIPIVGPALGAAAAGAAVASGLANVKKILSVDSGLPGGSSSSSSSVSASAPTAPSVNQGIISRETNEAQNQNITVQPTLVIDDVTNAQTNANNNTNTATI